MNVMAFRLKKPKLKFSARSAIAGAFVLLICAAAYTDSKITKKTSEQGDDYIYTAGTAIAEKEEPKILGEATFVGNSGELTEQEDIPSELSTEAGTYDTYFSAMQIERRKSRDEAYEMLRNVADSAESMPDVKEKAYNEMMVMAGNITIESNVQSMVKAKGFEDRLAIINGENLNVIVKTNGLLTNEVAQIKEIAVNESGFSAENIIIVEKNH